MIAWPPTSGFHSSSGREAGGGEFTSPRGLTARLAGGIWRRWRAAWHGHRPGSSLAVEAAVAWLTQPDHAAGLSVQPGAAACPGLTAAAIPTLLDYGQDEPVVRWAQWLSSIQRPSGALPDSGLQAASLFNTALTIRAAAALEPLWPPARLMAQRACEYLVSRIGPNGDLHFEPYGGSFERWADPAVALACVAPLVEASARWGETRWQAAARRVVERRLRATDFTRWTAPLHLNLLTVEALVDLGDHGLARSIADCGLRIADWDPTMQSATLAHLAALWYRLGEPQRADRALAWLTRGVGRRPAIAQRGSGVFFRPHAKLRCGLTSPGLKKTPDPLVPHGWTAKHLLDAARLQVAAGFSSGAGVHAQIDPHDGRALALLDWAQDLPPDARLADVGCGLGRYLHLLTEACPELHLTGVDVASPLLAALPPAIERCEGSLLRLPAADGQFDAAYTIEALEHCLLPERAIDELCRVVHPGGHVLIIDKHVAHQRLSSHEPWERWFTPEEPARWLAKHCDQVTVRPIPHGAHHAPTGLFLCWTGRKKPKAVRMAASLVNAHPW